MFVASFSKIPILPSVAPILSLCKMKNRELQTLTFTSTELQLSCAVQGSSQSKQKQQQGQKERPLCLGIQKTNFLCCTRLFSLRNSWAYKRQMLQITWLFSEIQERHDHHKMVVSMSLEMTQSSHPTFSQQSTISTMIAYI